MKPALLRAPAFDAQYRSYLRLVEPMDARYLSDLDGPNGVSAAIWRRRIAGFQDLADQGRGFCFIIVSGGQNQGVIYLRDFVRIGGQPSFAWGSWTIPAPRLVGLVTFAVLAILELGFEALGFPRANVDVLKADEEVVAYHIRAGAEIEGEDETMVYFRYTPAAYALLRDANAETLAMHRQVWAEVI